MPIPPTTCAKCGAPIEPGSETSVGGYCSNLCKTLSWNLEEPCDVTITYDVDEFAVE